MNFPGSKAQIFYNSDLVYKHRLYFQFLPCKAIFVIVLKYPLEVLLSTSLTLLEGSMPLPCSKVSVGSFIALDIVAMHPLR